MHNTPRSPRLCAAAAAAVVLAGSSLRAQTPGPGQIVACDFDIADDQGSFVWGKTMHLTGNPGSPTNTGNFVLINPNNPADDIGRKGYALPGTCNYHNLYIPPAFLQNLVNVNDPALAIPATNIIIANLPHDLLSGQSAVVSVYVAIPTGTPAGRYVGLFQVRDSLIPATATRTGVTLSADYLNVEVTVNAQPGIGVVSADSAARLDSVVMRARAGQRASAVLRVANTGNAALSDVRFAVTDLRSESATGISIPAQNITFSAPSLASLSRTDTARVTLSVNVPRGILGGRYRGLILVQAQGVTTAQIPLVVFVTSSRGLVFENNPVRNTSGIARIAFNGDPGTGYTVAIFDMNGLIVYTTTGTIYPGVVPAGAPAGTIGSGADFAAAVPWPLVNGLGQGVASGMYLVVVESIVNGQRQLAKDKLMVIR